MKSFQQVPGYIAKSEYSERRPLKPKSLSTSRNPWWPVFSHPTGSANETLTRSQSPESSDQEKLGGGTGDSNNGVLSVTPIPWKRLIIKTMKAGHTTPPGGGYLSCTLQVLTGIFGSRVKNKSERSAVNDSGVTYSWLHDWVVIASLLGFGKCLDSVFGN